MNRTKSTRILGMAIPQFALIAVMACCEFAVIGILGASIVNSDTSNPASPVISPINSLPYSAPSTLTATLPSPTTSIILPTDPLTLPLPSAPTSTFTYQTTDAIQLTNTSVPQPSTTPSEPLRVYFFDVGQGDSILILSPEGNTILIDGGEANTRILSYLQALGVQHIDLMIATHPHADHIGGLVQVLDAMPVSYVITNGQISTTVTFENFLDAITNKKIPFVVVKRGDNLNVGNLLVSVLSPESTSGDDLNNSSLVLRFVYGEISFLFMGDADKNAEAGILASGLPFQANILKVGHHGSNTASSPSFLAQVKPAVAIYMAGVGNSYGHPHAETLAALAAVGAQIYGTDLNGTIIVSTDGHTYKIDIQKNEPRAPPTEILPTSTLVSTPTTKPTLAFTKTSVTIIAPTPKTPSYPIGATAICNDGTYSFSQHRQGTCSHHGGVLQWLP
jgi:competence protein ComEC